MLFLLFVALASCIHLEPPKGVSPLIHFRQYLAFFNKTYSSAEDKKHAFSNYVKSHHRVTTLRREATLKKTSTVFGLTKFADMSQKEFKNRILMKTLKTHQTTQQLVGPAPNQPVDWVAKGMTTPIKNQLQCGSCWTFSATETIESANIIAGKISTSKWLAPQEIVDCDAGGSGCDGGWPQQAMSFIISQGGQDTEASYPYTGVDGTCASSSGTIGATISSVEGPIASEDAMYSTLQSTSPLSICADASSWQDYSGGVLTASQCGQDIDHAIQLTGYNPSQGGYWIVRNSWGPDWGTNGFIWLQYGQDTCGITSNTYYAVA